MIPETMWKVIPNFSNYIVYRDGVVCNRKTCKNIAPFKHTGNNTPYLKIKLIDDSGKRCTFRVHRLVYEVFVGPIADNIQIDHKDRNSMRNHVDNLEAKTHLENQKNRVFKKKVSPNQMALELT